MLRSGRCPGPSPDGRSSSEVEVEVEVEVDVRSRGILIATLALSLVAGGALADAPEGVTGRDGDDSHMRTRYGPPAAASGPETLSLGEVEADGVRTLPSVAFRPWRSGPAIGSSPRSSFFERRDRDSLRPSRTKPHLRSRATSRARRSQTIRSGR